MFSENQKISGRQIFRLLTYDLLGISALIVPPVLAAKAGGDGIFCIGIGLLLSLLYLKIIGVVILDMEGSFYSYLEQKLGKFLGKAVELCYFIYFLLLAGYTAHLFSSVIVKHLLREESFLLVLALLLLVTAYGVWGGIEGRARIYEILFWVILIPLFLLLFSALRDIRTDYWTPVFLSDWQGILMGSYAVFVCFSKVFLLLFAGRHVEKKRALLRAGKAALLTNGILHAVLYLILLGIFGSRALAAMDFPAVTMMSAVQLTGGFLKRTDALMFGVWFFALYALLSSAVYYARILLPQIFCGERAGEEKAKWTVFPVLLAVLGLAFLFYRNGEWCKICENFLWYVGTPFIVIVPLVLAAAVWFSGTNMSAKKGAHTAMLLCFILLCMPLSGCNTAELEDRNFPIEIAVTDTRNFGLGLLNEENGGNRLADYSHLKMVFLEREFVEDEKAMDAFLTLMETKLDVPRNTYVVVTENAEKLIGLGDEMGASTGTYLEEMFENVTEIKKTAYPTLGMLYQEKENRLETLLIPFVAISDDKPIVDHYFVWRRGRAAGELDNETALLSFFTTNEMDSYTISLKGGEHVQLSRAHNEISFAESGDGMRQIIVDVYCNGEVLYNENVGSRTRKELEQAILEYAGGKASEALEGQNVDVTDSYKKLGGYKRDWYLEYRDAEVRFEEDMQIFYRLHITWVNV